MDKNIIKSPIEKKKLDPLIQKLEEKLTKT